MNHQVRGYIVTVLFQIKAEQSLINLLGTCTRINKSFCACKTKQSDTNVILMMKIVIYSLINIYISLPLHTGMFLLGIFRVPSPKSTKSLSHVASRATSYPDRIRTACNLTCVSLSLPLPVSLSLSLSLSLPQYNPRPKAEPWRL